MDRKPDRMELNEEVPDVKGQTTLEEQIEEATTPKIVGDVIETQHTHRRRILIDDGPILETSSLSKKRQYQFKAERAVIHWHEGQDPTTVAVYGRRILATGKFGADTINVRYAVEELPEWLDALLATAKNPERRTVRA